MAQGVLPFQYEVEKKTGGMTSLAGLPLYIEYGNIMGMAGSLRDRLGGKNEIWTPDKVVMSLVMLNLAGGDCVDDLATLNADDGLCRIMSGLQGYGLPRKQSVQLHATPLSVAEGFGKQLNASPRAWIFTSATMAVKGDFSHYMNQMGLQNAQTGYWDSPFNYGEQGLFYVPENMPDPNSPSYAASVAAVALPVIQASGGRAFVLCTSLRAMREIHALLKEAFEQNGIEYPLLMQGESSRSELLERFCKRGNTVLVGSQSFWEGVDVRGEALSCVIIDKLPFAPPDDPVLSARIDKMNEEGKNSFMEYQLPYAVITLKQGAGRLIRDEADKGVLMICDPRLITKPYGRRIWQSLPPFKRTRLLSDAQAFFERITADAKA